MTQHLQTHLHNSSIATDTGIGLIGPVQLTEEVNLNETINSIFHH